MKHVLILAIVFLILASCSTRKDRAVNRAYHQTTTKFNVLFNGEEAISAGIEAEIASHQPNFWEQLPVEPFPLVDLFTLNPKENANFSRGEEKAVIAVQKHSMQFGSEQRNQQIDEAYMLLGKARYYNGRYLQALDAFNYIIDQLPNTSSINKAQLWKSQKSLFSFYKNNEPLPFLRTYCPTPNSPSPNQPMPLPIWQRHLPCPQPTPTSYPTTLQCSRLYKRQRYPRTILLSFWTTARQTRTPRLGCSCLSKGN